MNKLIDFYFDFISPYSYLAHKKILNINERKNFNYKAILLGGLHNLGNITAPAFNERKMKNMREDCTLIAKKNGISCVIQERSIFPNLSIEENIFGAWRPKNKNKIEQKSFITGIKNEKIKNELKNLTNLAFEKNIFGAPTFIVNNKLFWGQDRLEYALDEFKS